MNPRHAPALLALGLAIGGALAQSPVQLDTLLVTASPVDSAASEAMRSVWVIEREEIDRAGSLSLADLLARQPGLSIQRRGAPGVQADLGIRGSGFEQTLVLLDGVPIQNPQVGHHNLDIPVPLSHLERIEIVKGPGAIQHGGSATGGVINLITRRPQGREGVLQIGAGSHATRQLDAHLAGGGGAGAHAVSVAAMDSDGDHRAGPSDVHIRQALYTGSREGEAARLHWGAGALDKDFGAWGFYSAEYPDARERTESQRAWAGVGARIGDWSLDAQAYLDRHEDWFLTRIAGHDYINEHRTRVTGALASLRREDASGTLALGVDLRHEKLESNALQDHDRNRSSLWILRRQELGERTRVEASLNHARLGAGSDRWLPALAVSHAFNAHWRGFASRARSARAPSYTELHLATSANRGSADLRPEVSDYAELGLEGRTRAQRLQLVLYERRGRDRIDWTRAPGTATWIAGNLERYRGRGFEASWRWQPGFAHLETLGLGYDRLRVSAGAGDHEVKYAVQVPGHTWFADARLPLGAGLRLELDLRRPNYALQESATLADLALHWEGERLRVFVQGQNLLDRTVVETGFAPIPGRWLSLGFGMDLR